MIIETKRQLDIENIGADVQTMEAGIDNASLPFLFEMLSGSLYSNPIASICREITSNCFDSHVEANVSEPIVIKKGYDEEGTYISFIDVGIGLSPKRIQSVYMNYFSSTKRETNNLIGGFGLGSKSPLSYSDYFYITTISDEHDFEYNKHIRCPFNNNSKSVRLKGITIKYQYIFSKGILKPTIDLLNASTTTAHNGTEIRIYIKDSFDVSKFHDALSKHLCYFDNVYFDGWGIDNEYSIFEGKLFKYRNKNQYDSKMHIVLDKVVYPIDWKQLNMNEVNIAVGVKFEIGELLVTPNREQLRYTDEIITLVRQRIKGVIDELIGIFDKQNTAFDSYFDWLSKKDQRPFITFIDSNNYPNKLYLFGLEYVNKRNLYKHFQGIEYLANMDNLLSYFYSYAGEVKNKKLSKKDNYFNAHYLLTQYPNASYISPSSYLSTEKNWLVEDGYVFYPKLNEDDLKRKRIFRDTVADTKNNRNTSNPYYFNLGAGLKIYKLIKAIREEVELRSNKYRDLTENELIEYKEYKKEINSSLQKRLQGKVFVTSISENNSYDWNLESNKDVVGINGYKGIVIYGFKEDEQKLRNAVDIFRLARPTFFNPNNDHHPYGRKFNIIKIAKQNEKYFKNKDNMAYVDNLYGDNIIFRDIASLFKIECFFNEIEANNGQNTKQYIDSMKLISTDIGNVLEELHNFYSGNRDTSRLRYNKHQLKVEIVQIAKQFNLYNPNVEILFKKVDDWFKGVEIIRYMNINAKTLPYILKLLYEKKKRLNVEYYQRILNTDKSAQLALEFNSDIPVGITKFNQLTQNEII